MKILLVDDHPLVASALSFVMNQKLPQAQLHFESTYEGAINKLNSSFEADILLLDLNFSGHLKGYTILDFLQKKKSSKTQTLILSMHTERAYIKKAIQLGARGYIVKTDPSDEAIKGIMALDKGIRFFSPTAQKAFEESDSDKSLLSSRELEIAELVTDGLSSKDIAEQLSISVRTVECHRHNIMKKMKVNNTPQLLKALKESHFF